MNDTLDAHDAEAAIRALAATSGVALTADRTSRLRPVWSGLVRADRRLAVLDLASFAPVGAPWPGEADAPAGAGSDPGVHAGSRSGAEADRRTDGR